MLTARTRRVISSTGWQTPVSLFAIITETTAVSSSTAAATSPGADSSPTINRDDRHGSPVPFGESGRFENGGVFDRGRDDRAVAGPRCAEDGEVVRFRPTAGEHDLERS